MRIHFRVFETWRLSAALLIMSWHFLRFAPPGHEAASAGLYRLMPLMEMFFMISGFLIMIRYADELLESAATYRHFIVRRIARFYPLYLVTLGFFVVVAVAVDLGIVGTEDDGRYAWSALIPNILMIQAWGATDTLTFNYVSWSMSAEWFCYLLLPIIVLTWQRYGLAGLMIFALASVVAMELGVIYGVIPFESWLQANTWGAYRAFADFSLGALVAMAVVRSRLSFKSHWPGWITFTLAVVAMTTLQDSYVIVGLLGLAMFLSALAERNNPAGAQWLAPLHPLGRVSLGIYLIHPVIEAIFFSILWRKLIEPTDTIGFYVYWLIPMAATIGIAILSERYFEGPAARYIGSRWGGGRQKSVRATTLPAE